VGLRTRERVGVNGGARGRVEATRAALGTEAPRAGAEGRTQGAEATRGGQGTALGSAYRRGGGNAAPGAGPPWREGQGQGRAPPRGGAGRVAPPSGRGRGGRRREEGAGASAAAGEWSRGGVAPLGPRTAAPGLAGARAQGRRGGRAQGREGEGEGERGEGKGGELTSGIQLRRSPSPKPRAPQERERWERERLLRGRNQMRQMDLGEGGRAHGVGRGARAGLGRAGPGWAGLGHITDRNPRHARPLNGIQLRTENRNGTRRTCDIRQRNARQHDATPMTLRFCLYMTRTPVTILV
jgi:hypothetical protein